MPAPRPLTLLSLAAAALALCLWPASDAAAQTPQVAPPELTRFVPAELPEGTVAKEAEVALWITVGTDGTVREVEVGTSAGEPWDSAAVAAARRFLFRPATADGQPVLVRVPFTYRFRKMTRRGPIVPAVQPRRDIEPAPGLYLAGSLLEMGTRKPVIGLPVRLYDPRTRNSWEALTDGAGKFVFYGLPPGDLQLSVESGEFRDLERTVSGKRGEAPPDPEPQRAFYLAPSAESRYRTVIRDRRKPAAASEIALTEDEILKVPGTFGDPTRVVASLPGVARTPFGLGYYVVRGASFENTGFFVDGHPVVYLYHLLGGPAVVHPELVGELTFYPGGYPASYGRFATGIIDLKTKDPPTDRWHFDISVDLLKAAALLSIPFDDEKGEVTLSFRRSYYELLLPLFNDDISLAYTDYQARVKYAFSPDLRAQLQFFGAWDEVGFDGADQGEGQQIKSETRIGFHRVRLAVEWDILKELTWTTSTIGEFDFTNSYQTSEEEDDIDATIDQYFTQVRSFLNWKPEKTLRVEGGLDLMYGQATAKLLVPSFPAFGDPSAPAADWTSIDYSVKGSLLSAAPYILADWEPIEGVRLLPGFRLTWDDFGEAERLTMDPRLAVRWRLDDTWTVKLMGGIAHQLPAGFQVVEPFGDPSLPWTRGSQLSMGLEWRWKDDWEVSVEGFYNHLSNMIRPKESVDVTGAGSGEGDSQPADSESADTAGVTRELWSADMQGRAWGLEVLIRKRMTSWFYGWLSYTISRAERLRPPADWELYELDQTHILNLAWSFDLPNDWSIGARFQLASGNPYYPIIGSRHDADSDYYQPIYARDRSRLDLYHRLDVRIDKRIRYDTWMFDFYLDVQNVYNQANSEQPLYSYDYSKRYPGPYLPILPTLGVRAVF